MKKFSLIVFTLSLTVAVLPFFSTQAQVQEIAENRGAAATWQALQRLRTTATVLATQAHPDDEDAALLTWLARGAGVRTGLLSLNRGEGGANLIGSEQYDALGILRTEEFLAATRVYGLDVLMFTRTVDFGFSKRLDETLEHWNKETVLRDVVRQIRLYRPDIIVSRFHGKARDGHGNHQAAGLLTREAFKLAADANAYPDQFQEGLRPWQVKKLYLSLRESEPNATLKLNVGAYDPMLGRSYRELAAEGYRMHRSQSIGQARPAPGPAYSYLQLVESTVGGTGDEKTIFDKLDTSIVGLSKLAGVNTFDADLGALSKQLDLAFAKYDARQPWAISNELVLATQQVRTLIGKIKEAKLKETVTDQLLFLLNNKDRELTEALNKALGLSLELLVDPEKPATGPMAFMQPRETFAVAIPGQTFTLTHSVQNPSPIKLDKTEYLVQAPPNWPIEAKPFDEITSIPNARQQVTFKVTVPSDAPPTRPYWSRASELRDHVYTFNQIQHRGLPFAPSELIGWFNYEINGVRFSLTQPAQTVFVNRPYGEQRRALVVAPALSITLTPRTGVALAQASNTTPLNLAVNVQNNVKGAASGKVRLQLPAGWEAAPNEHPFQFAREGERANYNFTLTKLNVSGGQSYRVQAIAEYAGKEYGEGYQIISHRDLEPRHLYRPATMEVRSVTAEIAPNLNVAYVMGVGDDVPAALTQLGVKVTMLDALALASGNLDGYDAILVGIRATAVRNDLKAYYKRLLEYAERGGHLIYQYQTPEFDEAPYAPYPYKLTPRAEEVSEEDSTVTVLDAAHPFFNWPNKISDTDFANWVEERGSKWMTTWDARFQPLLECHDREQAPQKGGLMFARTGKGTFTYAAYAFYRQLPAGVPGAYRLFANIISFKRHQP